MIKVSELIEKTNILNYEDIEGTIVMHITIDNKEFYVNAQTETHPWDGRETNTLSVHNDSGGDYNESGLKDYIDGILGEYNDEHYIEHLNNKVNEWYTPLTFEEHLAQEIGEDYEEVKTLEFETLFDANFKNMCFLKSSNTRDDGSIIVVAINSSAIIATEELINQHVFESIDKYNDWINMCHNGFKDDDIYLYNGDFELARRAYNNLFGDKYE